MSGKVLLQDLILGVSKRANISEQEADAFVRMVFAIISDTLTDEKIIKIRNLGTFKLVEVDDRETVDAVTGTVTKVKGYRKLVFTPDNSLKDLINKPFAQFETTILNESTETADMEQGTDEADLDSDDEVTDEALTDTAEEVVDVLEDMTDEMVPEVTDEMIVDAADDEADDVINDVSEDVVDEKEVEVTEETLTEETHQDDAKSDHAVHPESSTHMDISEKSDKEDEVVASPVQYQHADFQKVNEQRVEAMSITTQTVEHQTIEHQSIVHQDTNSKEDNKKGLRITLSGIIVLFVFILLLMSGSYLLGYYRILCIGECAVSKPAVVLPAQKEVAKESKVEETVLPKQAVSDTLVKQQVVKESPKPIIQQAPSVKKETPKVDSVTIIRKKAAPYPQVPGGDYYIVGIKRVHRLKSGEGLLQLSRKTYGSKDFVKYIIRLNDLEDPDVLPLGAEIKLPELIKKSE